LRRARAGTRWKAAAPSTYAAGPRLRLPRCPPRSSVLAAAPSLRAATHRRRTLRQAGRPATVPQRCPTATNAVSPGCQNQICFSAWSAFAARTATIWPACLIHPRVLPAAPATPSQMGRVALVAPACPCRFLSMTCAPCSNATPMANHAFATLCKSAPPVSWARCRPAPSLAPCAPCARVAGSLALLACACPRVPKAMWALAKATSTSGVWVSPHCHPQGQWNASGQRPWVKASRAHAVAYSTATPVRRFRTAAVA
jgi:hypothetical protein